MTNATAQPPKPWAHQISALDFIRDKPGAMLAMDMGVGKTKIAIDLMEEIEAGRTLIMAPLSVVDHVWPREIRTHSRRPATIIPLGDQLPNVRAKLKKAADGLALATARKGPAVIIINYESAYREPLGEWLKGMRWDLLIMDESHRLKSPLGQDQPVRVAAVRPVQAETGPQRHAHAPQPAGHIRPVPGGGQECVRSPPPAVQEPVRRV